MKKIVSFGDSFVFGTELLNNSTGSQSWIGQVAKKLEVEYSTFALPGCGNDYIAQQIYSYFSNNPTENTLAVINWTWMCRWDFYIVEHEKWITLGPSCVPEKIANLVSQTQAQDIVDFYRSRANSSLVWNKFRNLQTIYATQSFLKTNNICNVQTYMDYEMFDIQFHAPDYIQTLQKLVKPDLQLFEGKNFVDWSRSKGYEVTEPGLHPLEEAHQHACNLWIDYYKQKLIQAV